MSELKAEQTHGEPGSLSAGPAVSNSSDMQIEPVAALAQPSIDADAPKVVLEQAAAGAPRMEAPDTDAPKIEVGKTEAGKTETGEVMILLSGARGWGGKG